MPTLFEYMVGLAEMIGVAASSTFSVVARRAIVSDIIAFPFVSTLIMQDLPEITDPEADLNVIVISLLSPVFRLSGKVKGYVTIKSGSSDVTPLIEIGKFPVSLIVKICEYVESRAQDTTKGLGEILERTRGITKNTNSNVP